VPFAEDVRTFLANALAPAQTLRVEIDAERHHLLAVVPDDQLSLAIGKRGQNVRLASKMLGCRIEIKSEEAVKDELASALASMLREMEGVAEEEAIPPVGAAVESIDYSELIPLEELDMLTERLRERLEGHAIHTVQDVLARDAAELSTIPGIGPVTAQKLLDMAQRALQASLAEAVDAQAGEE